MSTDKTRDATQEGSHESRETEAARRKEAQSRKENDAKYKQNIDRLNRARDEEIERALSSSTR